MNVILIDDSDFIRNNLIRLLGNTKLELSFTEAIDVKSGKEKILNTKSDVVIIDIRLPGGSGFDLIEFVKENSPNSKIVILTNFANEHYKEKAFNLGADYFFDKSIEFNKLILVLSNIQEEKNAI